MGEKSRYEILIKIASGGMGTVYLGRLRGGQGFTRLVAIKRAHPHLLEEQANRRMFLEEARISSRIRHPNVVSIQDVEEDENEIFLVMDYVAGESLAALLDPEVDAPLPLPVAIRILIDVCTGLDAAHAQRGEDGELLGIVHRDISPHNLLVGASDGVARITDFGIAKIAGNASGTQTGLIRGKIGYVAPECAEGGRATAKSDLFSLGVVAWEALVRRRLFQGKGDLETLRRITDEDAPPPSIYVEALSPFDDLVLRCLARRPEARPRSALAVAVELERIARPLGLVAGHHEVAAHVASVFSPKARDRQQILNEVTGSWSNDDDFDLAETQETLAASVTNPTIDALPSLVSDEPSLRELTIADEVHLVEAPASGGVPASSSARPGETPSFAPPSFAPARGSASVRPAVTVPPRAPPRVIGGLVRTSLFGDAERKKLSLPLILGLMAFGGAALVTSASLLLKAGRAPKSAPDAPSASVAEGVEHTEKARASEAPSSRNVPPIVSDASASSNAPVTIVASASASMVVAPASVPTVGVRTVEVPTASVAKPTVSPVREAGVPPLRVEPRVPAIDLDDFSAPDAAPDAR